MDGILEQKEGWSERVRARALSIAFAHGHGPRGGRDRLIAALNTLADGEALKMIIAAGYGVSYFASIVESESLDQKKFVLNDGLCDAARAGSVEALRALVAFGGDPLTRPQGNNLLIEACEAGRGAAVKELGSWGLSVREPSVKGECLAMIAAMAGAGLTKAFAQKGASGAWIEAIVKTKEPMGFEALDAVLELGADIDDLASGWVSPLAQLCEWGDEAAEAIEALLARGARPNGVRPRGGRTPWSLAASCSEMSGRVCEALLRHGAIPEPLEPGKTLNAGALAALEAWELSRASARAPVKASARL